MDAYTYIGVEHPTVSILRRARRHATNAASQSLSRNLCPSMPTLETPTRKPVWAVVVDATRQRRGVVLLPQSVLLSHQCAAPPMVQLLARSRVHFVRSCRRHLETFDQSLDRTPLLLNSGTMYAGGLSARSVITTLSLQVLAIETCKLSAPTSFERYADKAEEGKYMYITYFEVEGYRTVSVHYIQQFILPCSR